MNWQALKSELTADPLGRGYAGMSDEQAAAALNTRNRAKTCPIPSQELLAWAGANNRRRKLLLAAADTSLPADLRNICEVALLMLQRDQVELDTNKSDRTAMLNALVAGGVLTTADRDALFALATKQVSRLDELGLPEVHAGDVAYARSNKVPVS